MLNHEQLVAKLQKNAKPRGSESHDCILEVQAVNMLNEYRDEIERLKIEKV